MNTMLVSLVAAAAALVVIIRCVCVLYHSHWRTHPRQPWHWLLFGYSYIALATGAVCGAAALALDSGSYARAAVLLLLVASAGLILFDRRRRGPRI